MSMHHRILLLTLALSLAGCEGASRFGDFSRPSASAATQPLPPPRQQTFTPAPTSRVESSSLPPLRPATPGAQAGVSPQPGLPPAGSSVPIDPPAEQPVSPPSEQRPIERVAPPPPAQERPAQTAARPEPAPRQESPPTRTSVTGNWSAREASGGACKVTLSTTPTLDLYKASSAGCKTREMQRVTAWELRGEEIYLYETGGSVAARLRKNGSNYEGASAKTGAPITMSK
jgi:Protease inhibitor Inh